MHQQRNSKLHWIIALVILAAALALTGANYATDCKVRWPMLLQYLNVFLSMPAVILYLGIAGILLFRLPIHGLPNSPAVE